MSVQLDKAAWAAGGMKVTSTPTGKPPLAGQRGAPSSAGHLLICLVSLPVGIDCLLAPARRPPFLSA